MLEQVPQSGDRPGVVIGGAVATMYENIMHLPEMAGVGAGKGAVAGDKAQSDADVKATERAKVPARSRGWTRWMPVADSRFAQVWACCSARRSPSP